MRPLLLFRAAPRPGSTRPVFPPRKSRGFTLLELMIALGAIAVLTTGGIVAYRSYQGREDTTRAVESTRQLSNSLMQTYGQTGSFASLSDTDVINGNLKPMTLADKGGKIMNKWGGTVDVTPSTATSRAFAVTWNKVPSGACSGMSTQLARDFSMVRVNGSVVKSETKALDVGQTASMCGGTDDNSVELTSATVTPQDGIDERDPGPDHGAPVLALGSAPDYSFPLAAQKVAVDKVTPGSFVLPGAVIPPIVGASGTGSAVPLPNYLDMPAPAPATMAACGDLLGEISPNPQTSLQWVDVNPGCPTGYVGSHTYQKEQKQTRTASCPVINQPPAWSAWTAWADDGNVRNDINTCQTTCNTRLTSTDPANVWKPNPQSQTQWVAASAACAAGYTGSHTWQKQQVQTRTASCANPATASDPTWSAWSAWTDNGLIQNDSNTCVATCQTRLSTAAWQPNPQYQYQWVTVSVGCPAGYSGTHTYQVQQQSSRSASCSNPSAGIDPTWSGWSGWTNTGATQADYNTCAANCVAPGPTYATYYQWVTQNVGCPAGYTGTHTYQQQQYITYTTNYYCPAVTGAYAVYNQTNTGWQWTSATQADYNTCTPSAPPVVTSQKICQNGPTSGCVAGNFTAIDSPTAFNTRSCYYTVTVSYLGQTASGTASSPAGAANSVQTGSTVIYIGGRSVTVNVTGNSSGIVGSFSGAHPMRCQGSYTIN